MGGAFPWPAKSSSCLAGSFPESALLSAETCLAAEWGGKRTVSPVRIARELAEYLAEEPQ